MNPKSIIKYLLLLLVVGSVAYLALAKDPAPSKSATAKQNTAPNQVQQEAEKEIIENGVVVYYFYTTNRCPTCVKLEALADETIKEYFSQELFGGRLDWRVINTDLKESQHYLKDYKLYTKSIILSLIRDGKQVEWKNLPEIWELVHDPEAYGAYVEKEIRTYLEKI